MASKITNIAQIHNHLFERSVHKFNHVTYFMIHGPKVSENMNYELHAKLKKIILLIHITNHIGGTIVCFAHIACYRHLLATFSAQNLSLSSMLPRQLVPARERSGTHVIVMSRLTGSRRKLSWEQGLWGQHGAHMGPTGPMWAPLLAPWPLLSGWSQSANKMHLRNISFGCDIRVAVPRNYRTLQYQNCNSKTVHTIKLFNSLARWTLGSMISHNINFIITFIGHVTFSFGLVVQM